MKRIWYGARARGIAEVFRAVARARAQAAPIYEAVDNLVQQRKELQGKLDTVLKKHGSLSKARNEIAKELRQVLKTKQKYYDSRTLQPGVPQRFKVEFLKEELKIRLRKVRME